MNKHKFIKKGKGVWEDAVDLKSFTIPERIQVNSFWKKHFAENPLDFASEYEQIKIHKANESRQLTDHWKHWGASKNEVSIVVDFDQSSTLGMQQNKCRDTEKKVKNTSEASFAAALMCCDTPTQTASFIMRRFSDIYGISFDEMKEIEAKCIEFMWLQLEIGFCGKWTGNVQRPSDYELQELKMDLDEESVSIIPHPNHPSEPGGHPIVGEACFAFLNNYLKKTRNQKLTPDFKKFCDETGEARVDCGIHFLQDLETAKKSVNYFAPMIFKKIAA